MFISQVIFESEKENEDTLKRIMEKKLKGSEGSAGLLSSECWRRNGQERVGYALVTKWETGDDFKAWLSQDHARGHQGVGKENAGTERPEIKKTIYQFESAQLNE